MSITKTLGRKEVSHRQRGPRALPQCAHADLMPDNLQQKLSNFRFCPPCLLKRHIKDIRECQDGIKTRGGIFESKQAVLDEKEENGGSADQQGKRHRAWMRKWRLVKIQLWKDLEVLEEYVVMDGATDEVSTMVEEALDLWEEEKDTLTTVPGVKCEDEREDEGIMMDDDSPQLLDSGKVAEDTPTIRCVDQQGRSETIPLPPDTDDWGGLREILLSPGTDDDPVDEKSERTPLPPGEEKELVERSSADIPQLDGEANVDDKNLAEMNGAATHMMQSIHADEEVQLRTATEDLSLHTPSTPSRPAPYRTGTSPRPIIRHRSSTPSSRSSTPRSVNRVRINDMAFVSDPTSRHPVEVAHNAHTSAESRRHRNSFYRPSSMHAPGVWSSPDGHEKVQTSWFNHTWKKKDQDSSDEMEEDGESLDDMGPDTVDEVGDDETGADQEAGSDLEGHEQDDQPVGMVSEEIKRHHDMMRRLSGRYRRKVPTK